MAGFDVGAVVTRIKADTSDFKRGIAEARKETRTFASGLKNVGKMAVAGGVIIGTAAASAAAAIATASLKQAGAFEQAQVAFTTMLGSAEEADKMLRNLADFAKKTPFELQGIEQNAKMLLAMGASSEEVIPELKMLGDISSGLNVPMDRLALNFGQVRTQGKLTGRELRDFNVAGVPLIETLAKLGNEGKLSAGSIGALGPISSGVSRKITYTKEKIADLVSDGKIGFDDVKKAFEAMSGEGGKFENLMEAQSKTLPGMIENLKDEFNLLMREIGKELLPAAKQLVTFALEHLIPALREIAKWVKTDLLPRIGEFIGKFQEAKEKVGGVIDFLTGLFAEYKDEFEYIFGGIVQFIGWMVGKILGWWDNWGNTLISITKGVLSVIVSVIKFNFDFILNIIKLVIAIFKGDWGAAWTAVTSIFKSGLNVISTIFESLKSIVSNALQAVYTTITSKFTEAWNKAKEIAGNIRDAIRDAFNVDKRDSPSIRDTLQDLVHNAGRELGNLQIPDFRTDIRSSIAGVAPALAGSGAMPTVIVNLDGAIISDSIGASRMAEAMGDNIIRKLKQHGRF